MSGELLGLMNLVEGADVTPTSQAIAASEQSQKTLAELLGRWNELRDRDVKALNEELTKAGFLPYELTCSTPDLRPSSNRAHRDEE